MNKNQQFKTMYNRLDNYLKSILNVGDDINLISYFERILPEKKKSELKTIRKFKNLVESHGVAVRGATPIVPKEYTIWLENTLSWCKRNKEQVIRKMSPILPEKYRKNRKSSSCKTNHTTRSAISSYQEYYSHMYGYNKSYKQPLTGFAKEVESELKRKRSLKNNSYSEIVLAATRVVAGYMIEDVKMIACEYGYRRPTGLFAKKMSSKELRRFVAEKMVADLSRSEIDQLTDLS